MSEEILEKGGCVRCGKPSKNGGSGGRCSACLKKLATAKKTPGSAQRAQTKADDALRRQDGKNGTASHKSSGRGNRKDIVKQHQSAEKRTGQKLSPDRKDNGKGYAKGNTRSIPEKLNRGRHTADPKKLAAWRKNLKKHNLTPMEMGTLLLAKAYESGDPAIIETIEKSIGKKIAGVALAGSMAMGGIAGEAKADTDHLKGYLNNLHGMKLDGHTVSVKHHGKEGEKGSGVGKFSVSVGDYSMQGHYERAGDSHNKLKLSGMTHKDKGHAPFESDDIAGFMDEKGTAVADALHDHLSRKNADTSLWRQLVKPTKMSKSKVEELEAALSKAKEELSSASKKKIETLEKASKKQLNEMTKNPEVASWISKTLPRDDVATWFARAYKKDNSVFNDDNKTNLAHYGSMLDHHDELKDLRLDKSHDFETGMAALSSANSAAEKRHANNPRLITPSDDTKKILPGTGKNGDWHSLGVSSCQAEGGAMGHCGNAAGPHEDDNVLSLRKEKKIGNKTYHEPSLTFINNNGHLGEMKGRGNAKPTKKYHEDIKNLLLSDHVDRIMGGGYESHKNFSLADLPKKDVEEILAKKPDIDPTYTTKKHDPKDFPDKHRNDIERHNRNMDTLNGAFKEHGTLDAIMDSGKSVHRSAVLKHPAFDDIVTPDHVHKAIDAKDANVASHADLLRRHASKVDAEHSEKVLKDLAMQPVRGLISPHEEAIAFNSVIKDANLSKEAFDRFHQAPLPHVVKDDMGDDDIGDDDMDEDEDYMGENVLHDLLSSSKHYDKDNFEVDFNNKDSNRARTAIKSKHFGPEHVEQALNHPLEDVQQGAVQSNAFGPEHVEQALNHKSEYVRQAAVKSSAFGPEHMEQALNDKHGYVRTAAVESEHFGPEHVEQALNDKHNSIRRTAVESSAFGPEHMDQALNDEDKFVSKAAIKSKHFKPEHMEQALNHKDEYIREAAIKSKHFGPEHMDQAFNDKDDYVRLAAVKSKHFGPEHMEQALNDEDGFVRQAAVQSNAFGPEHMEQALNHESEHVRRGAVKSKHFKPEHMEQALNDEEGYVRGAAVHSKHFKPEHMDQALNDEDRDVRRTAIKSKAFGPEHVEQALNDKDDFVRRTAVESNAFGPEHMEQALNDGDEYVRQAAVKSKHFGPEHMEQALNDEDNFVRRDAVQSKHFKPEHMEQALNDGDEYVRSAAKKSEHFKPEHDKKKLNKSTEKLDRMIELLNKTNQLKGNKMSKSKIEELKVALSKAKEELSNNSPQMASPDSPEEGRKEVCEKCGHCDCDCTGKKKLKKSTEKLDEMIELLNKSKAYKNDDRPFQHGSVVTLKRAVTEKDKTRGYEVHEHTADGKRIVHSNVNYVTHLDNAMKRGEDGKHVGVLRMKNEKGRRDVPQHIKAEVTHGTRTSAAGKKTPTMTLTPMGDPHTLPKPKEPKS